jgi:hypothetical protein
MIAAKENGPSVHRIALRSQQPQPGSLIGPMMMRQAASQK